MSTNTNTNTEGQLQGRVIAVAGAGGSLGPDVCRDLAGAGATLACTDVDAERLETLTTELGLPEGRIDTRVADLLEPEGASDWAAGLIERFGRIDGLVHIVGGWRGGEPLAEFDLADLDWLGDLLFRTVVNSTRAFHDHLAASEHGRFLLVSSAQAQQPQAANAAYAATKAAAETWTLALADSFRQADSAATANIVVINAIVTAQMRESNPDKAYASFTDTGEIAAAIAYLCSPAAAKMNGKRLSLFP